MTRELKVKKNKEDDRMVVTVEGRIDANTAVNLDKELSAAVTEAKTLILDFDRLEYISSAGLRVLLGASKAVRKNGGDIKIINVGENIIEIFAVTGFINKLDITKK
ncbi:MAG: STAS domain-containing protein [Lachnospiraceae bacterium]|nr:STAS domain-containing protein [Lachnospiraceae bacterium]MBR4755005.1 STAS domain-containing protein [Lachnospiraceae bacterium]MBR4808064.1 STAS domain-containing protein [Lachnospiraceae bacterium]